MEYVHYIATVDQRRRQLWENLFGDDKLPVVAPEPRWQAVEPGRPETLAYDLDTKALHWMQRERLASHIANLQGLRLEDARALVETSPIPIRAAGVQLIDRKRECNAG